MKYKQELDFAKQAALEAGEIMRQFFLQPQRKWKDDQTPVTVADTKINRMVIDKVAEQFPDHSVLGEEESSLQAGARYTWVCDPVDGTMPYAHGLPLATFSLALCDQGRPVVGVVYDPFMDRLFWAGCGAGAFYNNKPMSVNNQGSQNSLVAVSGLEPGRRLIDLGNIMGRLISLGCHPMAFYTAILPACLVASGDFGAAVFNITKPEDGAAVRVIVSEAGGQVTDLFGNDQRYDQPTRGFIASNGVLHDELLKLIQEINDEV